MKHIIPCSPETYSEISDCHPDSNVTCNRFDSTTKYGQGFLAPVENMNIRSLRPSCFWRVRLRSYIGTSRKSSTGRSRSPGSRSNNNRSRSLKSFSSSVASRFCRRDPQRHIAARMYGISSSGKSGIQAAASVFIWILRRAAALPRYGC